MATRFLTALILGLALTPVATAQTIRFDTNVGNIDLILNPRGLPELRAHVDNILAYLNAGRYENVVLNRAANGSDPTDPAGDFVLQFGGFTTDSPIFSSFDDFGSVESFDPVIVDFDDDGTVDFDTSNLNNTRGQVSLALSSNPNTGTSSFFVNLGDNLFLDDTGFVPFARIADMSTIDYIMRLNQISDPSAGLASSNIPVLNDDNLLVIVERAFVLDPGPAPSSSVLSTILDESSDSPPSGGSVASVPEPPALVLLIGAIMVMAVLKGPRQV